MKSLDERPLWDSQGNTPEGILFQLSWEKVKGLSGAYKETPQKESCFS